VDIAGLDEINLIIETVVNNVDNDECYMAVV